VVLISSHGHRRPAHKMCLFLYFLFPATRVCAGVSGPKMVNDVLLCLFACSLAYLLACFPAISLRLPIYLSLFSLPPFFLLSLSCKRTSAHNNNMSNAESENAGTCFEFDPDGDVLLLVGTGEKSYELLVSSKVLGLASPCLSCHVYRSFPRSSRPE